MAHSSRMETLGPAVCVTGWACLQLCTSPGWDTLPSASSELGYGPPCAVHAAWCLPGVRAPGFREAAPGDRLAGQLGHSPHSTDPGDQVATCSVQIPTPSSRPEPGSPQPGTQSHSHCPPWPRVGAPLQTGRTTQLPGADLVTPLSSALRPGHPPPFHPTPGPTSHLWSLKPTGSRLTTEGPIPAHRRRVSQVSKPAPALRGPRPAGAGPVGPPRPRPYKAGLLIP